MCLIKFTRKGMALKMQDIAQEETNISKVTDELSNEPALNKSPSD